MKTIDELIEAQERCLKYPNCHFCFLHEGPLCAWIRDTLEYLKAYQKIEDEYEELKDWWAEEHAENVPLSWDELKSMEGQPVWYEHEFWKGWIILGKVEQGVNCEMIPDREERWYIVKDGSAKAYRKEREECHRMKQK